MENTNQKKTPTVCRGEYQQRGWQRLWMPEYFCYEVIELLKQAGLNLMFYSDWPDDHNNSKTLENIQSK